ncbi:MAG: carboxylate--amine ligase [Candidatus Eremiobacteraeota bacterium]|nr:carboxylate--amine ligase [Candidatus Eremiobacteraeota bacterium]
MRSLREAPHAYYLVGFCASPTDLLLADVDERSTMPLANDPGYRDALLRLLDRTKPALLHVQNDHEVAAVSRIRDDIESLGVKLFMPSRYAVETCLDKYRSYVDWQRSGVRVPRTILLNDSDDLATAFRTLGPKLWIRATSGAGGAGSLPTESFEFARLWVERSRGWGSFTASQCLTSASTTWLSLWYHGEFVVAQGRRRWSWNFGNRTLSGVTGITGVGETFSNAEVDRLAEQAVRAIDPSPHGIFGVDMTYGDDGLPYVTEINIARFFTTHYFFTKAGLNMPDIYCRLGIFGEEPTLAKRLNPLPDGLVWVRGMDVEPVLTTVKEIERLSAGSQTPG